MLLDVLEAQANALRAAVDAMYVAIRAAKNEPVETEPQGCQHTETENVGTFGNALWQCKACGKTV